MNVLTNLPLTGLLHVSAYMPLQCSVKMKNGRVMIPILRIPSLPKVFHHHLQIPKSLHSHPGGMPASADFMLQKPSAKNSTELSFALRRRGDVIGRWKWRILRTLCEISRQ